MAPGPLVTDAALSIIAQRLRTAREQAGYTLDQLAALTGLSKAHLSRLESGERQPSIGALLSSAAALRVPVSQLLGDDDATTTSPLTVYSGGETPHEVVGLQVVPCSGYPGSGALEALRMTISPQRGPGPAARHRGEEWLYVVHGTLEIEYDGRCYPVLAGSCAHFDADHPHRLAAKGEPTEVLVVAAQGVRALWNAHR